MSILKSFLDSTHPVFDAWKPIWEMNERRMLGGTFAVDEDLQPFEWEESKTDDHFVARKRRAVYVNFPKKVANGFVGMLSVNAPQPDDELNFGSLGNVQGGAQNEATVIWNNVDGRGQESSGWIEFNNRVTENAMATGHRWVLAEAPEEAATSLAEILEGRHPYAVEYSPLQVPNWQIGLQGIDFVLIKKTRVILDTSEGKAEMKTVPIYYLHVRAGFTLLDDIFDQAQLGLLGSPDRATVQFSTESGQVGPAGSAFSDGGWWLFDEDGKFINHGRYESTGGKIPMAVMYWRRHEGITTVPAMSWPALTEVGMAAAEYLNLGSAGNTDAIKAGGRSILLLGVNPDQHDAVRIQYSMGSRLIGVPPSPEGTAPQVYDAAQHSAHEAIEARQNRLLKEINLAASDEISVSLDASGVAREIEFRGTVAPRLSQVALNRQDYETVLLHFLAQRFGKTPDQSNAWNRTYTLDSISQGVDIVTKVLQDLDVTSITLTQKLIRLTLQEAGIHCTDEEAKAINDEVRQVLEERERLFQQNNESDGLEPESNPAAAAVV